MAIDYERNGRICTMKVNNPKRRNELTPTDLTEITRLENEFIPKVGIYSLESTAFGILFYSGLPSWNY